MSKFVCVRLVQTNGLDLTQFQFDYDLTFAVFMLNADGTVYGRYGLRTSHDDADSDMSLQGFRQSMEAVLKLHANFDAHRESLQGKRGAAQKYKVPEEFPSLKNFKSQLDYDGQVAKSCIHCHQIRDAQREELRAEKRPFTDETLYPWPIPATVGLEFDTATRATLASVTAGSPAARASLQAGDEIVRGNGQPIVSSADIQWLLHNSKETDQVTFDILRSGKLSQVTLSLTPGWRRFDISWRPTSWELRRYALGGIFLESLKDDERKAAGIAEGKLALRAQHVGQYGDHGAAKREGFVKGDIIVAIEGSTSPLTESELMSRILAEKKRGDKVPVTVQRGSKKLELKIPVQ